MSELWAVLEEVWSVTEQVMGPSWAGAFCCGVGVMALMAWARHVVGGGDE